MAVFVWLVSSVLLVFGMPSVLWTLALPSLTCQRRSGPQKRPLTLNNLLSFAQFEREVIGERRLPRQRVRSIPQHCKPIALVFAPPLLHKCWRWC